MQDRVLERRVVHRGDVPERHHRDVQDDREDRMRERARGALDRQELARHRSQEDLRQAEQDEDRHEVEQQQVLDHVHEEQLLGEPVDGRARARR